MNKLEEKRSLIKQFYKYHPGLGTEWGYSKYIGGMTDTGEWLLEVLLLEPIESLKLRLTILVRQQEEIDESNRQRLKEVERVKSLPEDEQKAYYINQRQETADELKKFFDNMERYLMWGKTTSK